MSDIDLSEIKRDLSEIKRDLSEIKRDMKIILEFIEESRKSTEKLNNHINFIEIVYKNMKTPLDFITGKLSYMISREHYQLT